MGCGEAANVKIVKRCSSCSEREGCQCDPQWCEVRFARPRNTTGYSSTDLDMGFANVREGTWYPPEHQRIP